MTSTPSNVAWDEDLLGRLAMQYRRTKSPTDRQQIAKQYSDTVDRLIQSAMWHDAPPPEDQLPDADMPAAFFDFWAR